MSFHGADWYFKQLSGQWIDITGVPEGDYIVHVEINFALPGGAEPLLQRDRDHDPRSGSAEQGPGRYLALAVHAVTTRPRLGQERPWRAEAPLSHRDSHTALEAADLCGDIEGQPVPQRELATQCAVSFLDGTVIAADPGSVGKGSRSACAQSTSSRLGPSRPSR